VRHLGGKGEHLLKRGKKWTKRVPNQGEIRRKNAVVSVGASVGKAQFRSKGESYRYRLPRRHHGGKVREKENF